MKLYFLMMISQVGVPQMVMNGDTGQLALAHADANRQEIIKDKEEANKDQTKQHSSYLSQPPQPAVVYFFLAGVLFSTAGALVVVTV